MDGRVVLTVKANNKQEALLAIDMMKEYLDSIDDNEEVDKKVVVTDEGEPEEE